MGDVFQHILCVHMINNTPVQSMAHLLPSIDLWHMTAFINIINFIYDMSPISYLMVSSRRLRSSYLIFSWDRPVFFHCNNGFLSVSSGILLMCLCVCVFARCNHTTKQFKWSCFQKNSTKDFFRSK